MLSLGMMLVFAFVVTVALIPVIINVSRIKRLFDEPLEYRKVHFTKTPNLGGIAIFTGLLLGVTLLIKSTQLPYLNYFVAASFIIAIVGVKDDLVGIAPAKKFNAQIAAALIMSVIGDIRITDFHGFLGIHELAFPLSIIITCLTIMFICNAMNLLDGIDSLAGGIGLVASITYALCFYRMGSMGECMLAVGIAGAIAGFLCYNVSPAKIFMGDCGSLIIGFVLSIISIRFIELNKISPANPHPLYFATPAIAISILIIPLYDALRVFSLRIIYGRSPFVADQNHLHHRLVVFLKLTHMQGSMLLIFVNIIFIVSAFSLQKIGNTQLVLFTFLLAICLNIILWRIKKTEGRKNALIVTLMNMENEKVEVL